MILVALALRLQATRRADAELARASDSLDALIGEEASPSRSAPADTSRSKRRTWHLLHEAHSPIFEAFRAPREIGKRLRVPLSRSIDQRSDSDAWTLLTGGNVLRNEEALGLLAADLEELILRLECRSGDELVLRFSTARSGTRATDTFVQMPLSKEGGVDTLRVRRPVSGGDASVVHFISGGIRPRATSRSAATRANTS